MAADVTEPVMARLEETPPRCPRCNGLLPGIDTQQRLATFLYVRCAAFHVWFRGRLLSDASIAAITRHMSDAREQQERRDAILKQMLKQMEEVF